MLGALWTTKEVTDEHPHTLGSMNNLATALDIQVEYEEAEAMLQLGF